MNHLIQGMSIMGTVKSIYPDSKSFDLQCRNGDIYHVQARVSTDFNVMQNLDALDWDRVPDPEDSDKSDLTRWNIKKYIKQGMLISVEGVYQQYRSEVYFDASSIRTVGFSPDHYAFEETHWWLKQITLMADDWLDDLFNTKREYTADDFATFYRTNLNITGRQTDEYVQECATLSRLIYGLSSAYLLTGSHRFYLAAKAGVDYQRQTFRSLSHDGNHCFWAYGWKKLENGSKLVVPSQNGDDLNSIALYEQIYALAGLAQFYRISQDWEVMKDIERTINTFNDFYLDDEKATEKGFPGYGGYFSHVDYVTMRPDTDALGKNKSRKNWNSIGDHVPAYLVNVLLALDPLPQGENFEHISKLRDKCQEMLEMTLNFIIEKFPDPDPQVPYVNERFYADWKPDHEWGWQLNRAIVGHNLKIAWNMTRCANYFLSKENECLKNGEREKGNRFAGQAKRCMDLAVKLGDSMSKYGIDPIHGGLFDAVERNPSGERPIEFTWSSTKDFWQQEQGILAYLILHGANKGDTEYLSLARELMAFWNLYFLDTDNHDIFFRVSENGIPIIKGQYGNKGSHAKAGYHAFELNYLAHVYLSTYVQDKSSKDKNFCLFFKPSVDSGLRSINVLPDFLKPADLEIASVTVNGISKTDFNKDNFQIKIVEEDLGKSIVVEFHPLN